MIITKGKNFSDILESLQDKKNIVILGCSECATVCNTGGIEQVTQMKEKLENEGKNVLAGVVLSTSCNYLLTKKELKLLNKEIENADALLSMACGNGVQTISSIVNKPILPSNDTEFVGEKIRNGIYEENCRTCGDCQLGRTAGICPVTRCSKGLLNGPCGGSINGKCEVDENIDCAWILIFNKLNESGNLSKLEEIQPLRSYSNSSKRKTLNTRKKR